MTRTAQHARLLAASVQPFDWEAHRQRLDAGIAAHKASDAETLRILDDMSNNQRRYDEAMAAIQEQLG